MSTICNKAKELIPGLHGQLYIASTSAVLLNTLLNRVDTSPGARSHLTSGKEAGINANCGTPGYELGLMEATGSTIVQTVYTATGFGGRKFGWELGFKSEFDCDGSDEFECKLDGV